MRDSRARDLYMSEKLFFTLLCLFIQETIKRMEKQLGRLPTFYELRDEVEKEVHIKW